MLKQISGLLSGLPALKRIITMQGDWSDAFACKVTHCVCHYSEKTNIGEKRGNKSKQMEEDTASQVIK